MLDVIALVGQAVPIAGDFLAGVTQNIAANMVCDLVTGRLRQTTEGTQAADALQENPQGAAQRSEAARVLTLATQADPEYARTLNSAIHVYQGTTASGSPHHQVNMGGGIAGKGHQVAGGNITNRKHSIRIGLGVAAVVAVLLGGVGVANLITDDDSGGKGTTVQDPRFGDDSGQIEDLPQEDEAAGGLGGSDPIELTYAQMQMAVPSVANTPRGMKLDRSEVYSPEREPRILPACRALTAGTNCAGFRALGAAGFAGTTTGSEVELRFSILSFDTLENAGVAMKGLVSEGRTLAGANGKPMKVESGAEETVTIAGDEEIVVTMRIGTVLAEVRGINVDNSTVTHGAMLQIERIKLAAADSNPDA